MKKLLVLAALTAAAAPALASKARLAALGDSHNIVDFQTALESPYQFMDLGTLATFEWGNKAEGSVNPHAEGGFVMKHEGYAYGAYLGRRSEVFSGIVTEAIAGGASANLLLEQNPINLYYASKMADWTWGINVKYSNGKKDATDAKSSSTGLALGATNGTFSVDLTQGISAKTEAGTQTIESKGMTDLTVSYALDENMKAYVGYAMVKADGDFGAGSSTLIDAKTMNVGFVNTVVKNDDVHFFYGIEYNNEKIEGDTETSTLPVWMGVEANATSWMVMRASVKQSVLLNEEKADNGDKSDVDSIAFATGLGFKLGKGMLDASFGTANAGHLSFSDGSTDKFLTNVAYTYMF